MSWHEDYARCTECGETSTPYKAIGLCHRCYCRHLYRTKGRKKVPDALKRPCPAPKQDPSPLPPYEPGPVLTVVKRQPEWVHRLVTDLEHGLSLDESLRNWPLASTPQRWLARQVLSSFTSWRMANPRTPAGSFVYEEPEF